MSEKEIKNARIKRVSITMADHGCLTFWVYLDGDCWGVGVGGYCIGKGYLNAKSFDGCNKYGLEAIMRVMDTVGVSRWEDLEGKYVRVEVGSLGDTVTKIGHIIENKWFDLKEFFASHDAEADDSRLVAKFPLEALPDANGIRLGWRCPKCQSVIDKTFFCPRCGQAIKWSRADIVLHDDNNTKPTA